jgi:hypothetical protein
MGSCSNRSDTKSEKLSKLANNVRETKDYGFNWQTSKGAEIRGILGV